MVYKIPILHVPAITLVHDYIANNPGCTSRQMAKALKMTSHAVGCDTGRLRAAGLIRKVEAEGERRMCWELGEDTECEVRRPDGLSKSAHLPKQTTVSTWEPHMMRDSLVSALFGQSVVGA